MAFDEQFVAGSYTTTWNGVSIGISEGDDGVPTITSTPRAQPIESSDRYGMTRVEAVHLGYAFQFQATLLEYGKAVAVLNPFGAFGTLGPIGVLKRSLAKQLVMTAVAGTSATPATLTVPKSMIAEDFDVRLFFGPKLRVVPIRLDVYAYDAGAGDLRFCTTT